MYEELATGNRFHLQNSNSCLLNFYRVIMKFIFVCTSPPKQELKCMCQRSDPGCRKVPPGAAQLARSARYAVIQRRNPKGGNHGAQIMDARPPTVAALPATHGPPPHSEEKLVAGPIRGRLGFVPALDDRRCRGLTASMTPCPRSAGLSDVRSPS